MSKLKNEVNVLPGIARTKTQGARELLRKAIESGTIKDVLWGKELIVMKNLNKSKKASIVVSPDDDPDTITLEDASLLDSIAIWNNVLVSRIMKTRRLLNLQRRDDFAHAVAQPTVDAEAGESNMGEDDIDGVVGNDNNNEDPKNKSEKRISNRQRKRIERKRQLTKSRNENRQISKSSESGKPETNTFEDSLQLSASAKKQRKVSDIIKSVQTSAFANRFKPIPPLSKVAEENNKDESENSSMDSIGSTEPSSSSEEDDRFDAQLSPKLRWGGTNFATTGSRKLSSLGAATAVASIAKKYKANKKQEYSLQVVEGLFNMSNELREERESIMAHGKDGSTNMEAFFHRETTLKYNEELDDIATNHSSEVTTQRKAALLRLKRAAIKYNTYKTSNVNRFEAFWDYITKYNEQMDRHDAYADYAISDDSSERHMQDNDFSVADNENAESDQIIPDDGKPSVGLESMFEENLGLLFATKQRAASELSYRLESRGNSTQVQHRGLTLRPPPATGTPRDPEIEIIRQSGSDDNKDTKSGGSDGATIPSPMNARVPKFGGAVVNNQSNISTVIDRMKALGVYSDEKFRHTYGVCNNKMLETPTNRRKQGIKDSEEAGSDSNKQSLDLHSSNEFNLSPVDRQFDEFNISKSPTTNRSTQVNGESLYDFRDEVDTKRFVDSPGVVVVPATEESANIQEDNMNIVEDQGVSSESIEPNLPLEDWMHRIEHFPLLESTFFKALNQSQEEAIKLHEKLQRKQKRKERNQIKKSAEFWLQQQLAEFSSEVLEAQNISGSGDDICHSKSEGDSNSKLLKDLLHAMDESGDDGKIVDLFVNNLLHRVDIDPFDDRNGEQRAMYERLSVLAPNQTSIDPVRLQPHEVVQPKNFSLKGKWQYDKALPSFVTPKIYRNIHRAVVKRLRKGQREQSKFRSQYSDRQRYNIRYRRNIYKELVFDPERRCLILRTCEDHEVLHSLSVKVSDVYLTDSAYQDMVTVRTSNTSEIPSGYLGTFPSFQWRDIEEEINSSILLQHLVESKDLLDSICGDCDGNGDIGEGGESISSASMLSPAKKVTEDAHLLPFQKLEKLREDTQIVFHKFPSVHEGPGRDHVAPGLEVHPHDSMVYRKADARLAKRKAALLALENELYQAPTESELYPLQSLIPKLADVIAHPASQNFIQEHLEAIQLKYEQSVLEEEEKIEEVSIKKILSREIAKKEAAERAAQNAVMTRVMSSDRLRHRLAPEKDFLCLERQQAQGYQAVGHVACGDTVTLSLLGIPAAPTKPIIEMSSPSSIVSSTSSQVPFASFVETTDFNPSLPSPMKPRQPMKSPSFRTLRLAQSQSSNQQEQLQPQVSHRPLIFMDDSTLGSDFAVDEPISQPNRTSLIPQAHGNVKVDSSSAHLLPGASSVYRQYLSPYVPGLSKDIQETLSMTSSLASDVRISQINSSVLMHPSTETAIAPHPPSSTTTFSPSTATTVVPSGTATGYSHYLPPLIRWQISGNHGSRILGAATPIKIPTTRNSTASRGSTHSSASAESTASSEYSLEKSSSMPIPSTSTEIMVRVPQIAAKAPPQQQDPTERQGNNSPDTNIELADRVPFSYAFQIIMLIETRRIMQLYFTKKFLQMDIAVNVHLTFYDATESLVTAPELHGLIFVSYLDLLANGVQKSLKELIPLELDKSRFTIIVYDVAMGEEEENLEELTLLESCEVTDIMYPPYTVGALKGILDKHKRKQEMKSEYSSGTC
jgi:hypothetical protein